MDTAIMVNTASVNTSNCSLCQYPEASCQMGSSAGKQFQQDEQSIAGIKSSKVIFITQIAKYDDDVIKLLPVRRDDEKLLKCQKFTRVMAIMRRY